MSEQKNRFDEKRIYACRCPSCHQFMNVPGITLNNDKHIRCRCGAIGRTDRWIEGGRLDVRRGCRPNSLSGF